MTVPAYLLVFSEAGDKVPEEEFNNWYEEEHIPLRVPIPAFLNWTRWKASDGAKPYWGASYDLTCYEDTLKAPYSTLAETRSEREKGIFKDCGVLERRTYDVYSKNESIPKPSALFDPKKSAPFVTFVSVDLKAGQEEEYNKWYDEEHIPLIATIPGWIRSRRFVLKDWSRAGVEGQTNQIPPPKYLAVHEYARTDALLSPDTRVRLYTPWMQKMDAEAVERLQVRRMQFHRSWERG